MVEFEEITSDDSFYLPEELAMMKWTPERLAAKQWIEDYADGYGFTYQEVMDAAWSHYNADNGLGGWGNYLTGGSELEGEWTSSEFWDQFEILTGRKVENRHNFFSCSC